MKIVNPNDTNFTISFIPRFYPDDEVTVTLRNDSTREYETIESEYYINSGIFILSFDYTFTDKQKYQITIKQGEDLIYLGRIFATDQQPQTYKITTGLYE